MNKRFLAFSVVIILLTLAFLPVPTAADAAGDTLLGGFDTTGTAAAWTISLGTANRYSVLGLDNTKIQNSNVVIYGNEGVSAGGKLVNMAPSTITANVCAYAAGQYSGPGKLGGTINIDPDKLTQNNIDALSASATAAGLTPDWTYEDINSATTYTGVFDLNVVNINGDITRSLVLSGPAHAVFVVNVSGTLALGGSDRLGIEGGVTANHVLYNFTGNSGTISTHVGNQVYGTLLAPNYNFSLDGAFYGEVIGGGDSLTLKSGARVFGQPLSPADPYQAD